MPRWSSSLVDEPNINFEGAQDFTNAGWALLVEGSAHVLEVRMGKFLKHLHLIWINDFHDILFVYRFIELGF